MRKSQIKNAKVKCKRTMRVRKHLHGTSIKPRMCVVKTNRNIFIQLIDDDAGITIASASTHSKENRTTDLAKKNKATARKLGEHIAELAKEKNVKEAIFDRGPAKYHGILAEIADGARGAGLKI